MTMVMMIIQLYSYDKHKEMKKKHVCLANLFLNFLFHLSSKLNW